MGLSVALGSALAGLKANGGALEIISRNISNAGTPGYHRQSLNVVEARGGDNSYVRSGTVTRAFDQILQNYYTRQVPDTAYGVVRADFLDRLQTHLGKPGDAGSLDTLYGDLLSKIDKLAASPDSYTLRAELVSSAQTMAQTLNSLTDNIQGMRQEAETKIATSVSQLNDMLKSLEGVNAQLADFGLDATSRALMSDQRDRLVSSISEMVDVRVDYRQDGTVAIATRSGTSLLDVKRSIFEFQGAGSLDESSDVVGKLTLLTPAGIRLDVVEQNMLQSGAIAGLLELRDQTLVDAQRQLDDIATALAQTFSMVQRPGVPVPGGGFDLDAATLDKVQPGNDILVSYTDASGAQKSLKLVNAAGMVPVAPGYTDANGTRVLHVDMTDPATNMTTIVADINGQLGAGAGLNFTVSGTGAMRLQGGAGFNIGTMTARTTSTATQGDGLGLNLFVDARNAPFTNSLVGNGQKSGFAGRITLNTAIVNNNKLLVDYGSADGTGDSARIDYIAEQFRSMKFASESRSGPELGNFRLNGSLGDLVSQTIDYQGNVIATAMSAADMQKQSLDQLSSRMEGVYGVDVNEEVARLMELQTAYAANARVVSVVQELLDALMQSI